MSNQLAIKAVEKLSKSGSSVERLPPSEVVKNIYYQDLSDMIDIVIHDIIRVRPEAFDNTSGAFFTVSSLKAYLYTVAMWHFAQCGVLNSGGFALPDATGVSVPNSFLAWLQYIGPYSEGDLHARAQYQFPAAMPATTTNDLVYNVTPVETNLCLSAVTALQGFQMAGAAFQEMVANAVGGTTQAGTLLAVWNNVCNPYSSLMEAINYPASPMWERCPKVPDASFYSFPSTPPIVDDVSELNPYFGNPFRNWDVELAQLYWTTYSLANVPIQYPFIVPRPGVMAVVATYNGVAGTTINSLQYLKQSFCFILRNTPYDPRAAKVENIRAYHGDRLASFIAVQQWFDWRGYQEVVTKSIMQCWDNGAAVDPTQFFAAIVTHGTAMLRKIQLSTVSMYPTTFAGAGPQIGYLSSAADGIVVFATACQLINEVGPVVLEGRLLVPAASISISAWYALFATCGFGPTPGPYAYPTGQYTGGTSVATWSWGGNTPVVLNSTWNTNYAGMANRLIVPWITIGYFNRLTAKLASNGVAYGKGELLFPPSRGPRGGAIMLTRCALNGNAVTDLYSPILNFTGNGIQAIGAHVPIAGPDITLAAVLRPFVVGGSVALQVMKYVKVINNQTANEFLDRYVSDILSPGGVFDDLLAKEMEMRHGPSDAVGGLFTASDNMDACLWGALKGIAGNIASAIQPAASAAASIGCGSIPVVGIIAGPVCKAAATNLLNYVGDMSRVSTNRNEIKPPQAALEDFYKAMPAPRQLKGAIPEDRRPSIWDGWSTPRAPPPKKKKTPAKPAQKKKQQPAPKKVTKRR